MTIEQIFTWVIAIDTIVLTAIGFFLAIGFLFLVTAVYSLIYDKAFRKKYLGKLSAAFVILLALIVGTFYVFIKYGYIIL
ncbi:MAG: hypothetical protein HOE03_05435 [Nitrosomonadales bacterium]|jgi:Ni,Fe-hydrogenase I cytochrome b subunit|nr:hypothetical protein [Nitrosomonadales bacterium]MBT4571021.1 hypothetical protein [Nitrosomonadales bacterium]MBT4759763.1 hypothetical protein [Nitrosomonadales bacterium]MBT5573642.1 hypothetical protein [Nitrosomonadales bacterium]MBT6602688.1 hypothetical protein [Nitrosomonadales bacterium]